MTTAAMAAIKRKKNIEQQLGQTQGQIGTLEHQINAIESANINRETLAAMQKASEAMKSIHGKLNPDKVDEIMYVDPTAGRVFRARGAMLTSIGRRRDQIREQNALSDEISRTMVDVSLANEVDETELEDELEQLQQEQLDEQMLGTGTVPVSDAVNRMPAAANGERTGLPGLLVQIGCAVLTAACQQSKERPRWPKRTTRRPSYGNCKPRWPCETVDAVYKAVEPCVGRACRMASLGGR